MSDFKRLTRVRPGNVGSLGLLPLEVCNTIYTFLLADFSPQPKPKCEISESTIRRHLTEHTRALHSIDTAILRVSRDIHLEAYDVMVKENRFVYVRSRGVPNYLLSSNKLPIVTANEDHVRRFKGYVLEVTMTSHEEPLPGMPPRAHDPFDVMILARDLGLLCVFLMGGDELIPGFADRLHLALNLGLVVTAGSGAQDYKDLESLERYFSEKTQKEILQPFRDFLYEVHNIQVRGLVSTDIAKLTCQGAALSEWGGPQEVLDYFTVRKETAMQFLKKEETSLARGLLVGLASEITMLRRGSQWARLVQEGDEHFITHLAELYFRLALGGVHLLMATEINEVVLKVAGATLRGAKEAMTAGHWKEGFTWQPPQELRAKYHFRMARFARLRGKRSDFQAAMQHLDRASLLSSDDSAIMRELRLLMDWVSEPAVTA